jgi:hypothetical protein
MSKRTQSAHTPLEWSYDTLMGEVSIYGDSHTDNKHCIAIVFEDSFGRTEADAAYIVQACNSFPALVSALADAENWLREFAFSGPDEQERQGLSGLLADMRAALSAAEGER